MLIRLPVMEKITDFSALQARLQAQQLELIKQISTPEDQAAAMAVSGSDRSFLAQIYVSQEQKSNDRARAGRVLEAVEAALARIEAGSYGLCTSCEKQIQPGRLRALPYTELCFECKRDQENSGDA